MVWDKLSIRKRFLEAVSLFREEKFRDAYDICLELHIGINYLPYPESLLDHLAQSSLSIQKDEQYTSIIVGETHYNFRLKLEDKGLEKPRIALMILDSYLLMGRFSDFKENHYKVNL